MFHSLRNISVVILIFQNDYVNCHRVGSVFQECAWVGFPCILNEVIITISRAAVKIKEESCTWKCCINSLHHIYAVTLEGTEKPPQTQFPATSCPKDVPFSHLG